MSPASDPGSRRDATTASGTDPVDAIVVFGAAIWPTGPSLSLRVRVDKAAELFDRGRASTIVCTGGWSAGVSEAQRMRQMLIDHGVPTDAIIPDDGGVDTRAAISSIKRFDGGRLRRVIAVSSPYHLRRIAQEARRQGLALTVCGAERPGPITPRLRAYDRRQQIREAIAAPAYALRWQWQRLLAAPGIGAFSGPALRALRHVSARVRFLVHEADAVAAASASIAQRIKTASSGLSDTVTTLTPTAGLRAAVDGVLGSRFGIRHGRLHAGIDLRASYGTPIVAAAAGTALFVDWIGPYGNVVVIDHGAGLATVYAHLAGTTIAAGDSIVDAQRIGYVGETGRSSGPHLHFEVRVHGSPVDPLAYVALPKDVS